MAASIYLQHLITAKPWRIFLFGAMVGVGFISIISDATAASEQDCPSGLTTRIQKNYQSIEGFSARFTQEDQRINGLTKKAGGTVAYLKPGRMRWEYLPPEEQLLVTDGETVWLYDPLLENVTVHPLGKLTQGTPLAFLLGLGNLDKDFQCRSPSTPFPKDGLRYLELVPRQKIPGLAFVQMGISPQKEHMTSLRMVDPQGNIRTIHLADFINKKNFPPEHFRFEIKPGMEIIKR